MEDHALNSLGTTLRSQLTAAPPDIQAMAIAEEMRWEEPDLALSDAQRAMVQALLSAYRDARSAIRGCVSDFEHIDVEKSGSSGVSQELTTADRLKLFDKAIVISIGTRRVLRESGIRAAVTTLPLEAPSDEPPVVAELRLHPYTFYVPTAAAAVKPSPVRGDRQDTPVSRARLIRPTKNWRVVPGSRLG